MDKLIKICFLILLVLLMNNCSSNSLEPKNINQIKNTGVISLVGNNLDIYHNNLLAQGLMKSEDISNWGIDTYLANTLSQSINKKFNSKTIDNTNINPKKVFEQIHFNDEKNKLNYIKDIMDKNNVDSLFVIIKAPSIPPYKRYSGLSAFQVPFVSNTYKGAIAIDFIFYQQTALKDIEQITLQRFLDDFSLDSAYWDKEQHTINKSKSAEVSSLFKKNSKLIIELFLKKNKLNKN